MNSSMKAWVCPECGQWGRDEFGRHRPPDKEAWSAEMCDEAPVLVELGPLLEHLKNRDDETERP